MEVQETDQGLIVPVNVKPNSPGFGLRKKDDKLFLDVTNPPREGRANQEIMRELPRLLRCEVRILSGLKSKRKLLLLRGITRQDLDIVLESR
jgi:uncharacterized protein (TIGR00251 family)